MNEKFFTVAGAVLFLILVACGGTKPESNEVNATSGNDLSPSRESADSTADSGMHMMDSRDGQIYKTVTIGSQTWMSENLNYEMANSTCYDGFVSNCYKNGRLYAWKAALESCPVGWHLPTQSDWHVLFSALGGKVSAAIALKTSKNWGGGSRGHKTATNASGFSALLSGYEKSNGEFSSDGETFFWSSDYYNDSLAYFMGLRSESDEAFLLGENKDNKYSVRCLKDDSLTKNEFIGKRTLPFGETSNQFVDIRDGNVYKMVTYGKQTWMAEDLAYKAEHDDECLRYYCGDYGSYTWKIAMGDAYSQKNRTRPVRGICPIGWHLPDTTEWNTLISVLGGKTAACDIFESKADNGFSMVANGNSLLCTEDGVESVCAESAFYWSSDKGNEDDYALGMRLDVYVNGKKEVGIDSDLKREDMPIRCVKDEATQESASNDGLQTKVERIEKTAVMDSVVDSRDGQTYKMTKIGNQVWMAENLNYKTAGSFCYHDSTQYCELYGRFYTWASAMDSVGAFSVNGKGCGSGTSCPPNFPVRGVCPEGFHLPTLAEWKSLVATAGGEYDAASKLMSAKKWEKGFDWVEEGTDDYGFSAYPSCNMEHDGTSGFCNPPVNYWSSIESSADEAYHMSLQHSNNYNGKGIQFSGIEKHHAFTVRCVMD